MAFLVAGALWLAAPGCWLGPPPPPLYGAIEAGDAEQVRALIAAGADVNYDYNGETALDLAVQTGDLEIVKILLDAGADPDLLSGLALLHAIWADQPDIAEALLAAGADPNEALDAAVRCGRVRITQLLLGYGADPDGRGRDTMTPLLTAAAYNHEMVVLEIKAVQPPRERTTHEEDQEPELEPDHQAKIARLLLDAGANPNARGPGGDTALHEAADWGQLEVVRVLLEHGADPNTLNDSGWSVLDTALARRYSDMAELLREHGALRGFEVRRARAGEEGSSPPASGAP